MHVEVPWGRSWAPLGHATYTVYVPCGPQRCGRYLEKDRLDCRFRGPRGMCFIPQLSALRAEGFTHDHCRCIRLRTMRCGASCQPSAGGGRSSEVADQCTSASGHDVLTNTHHYILEKFAGICLDFGRIPPRDQSCLRILTKHRACQLANSAPSSSPLFPSRCSLCGERGATLGCRVEHCNQSFHLPCCRAAKCRCGHSWT